jgi:all-trans-retinol 13,14-reductase
VKVIYSGQAHLHLSRQKWDVIIVGSGLGGLTAASLLARARKNVLILERHYVPGGFTHTFKRKGFEWDVGVHYVGQVESPRSILRKIFDYVSEGHLEWAPMGDVYDRAIIEGDVYDFVPGLENQIQRLIQVFPSETKAIRRYYRRVRSAAASSAWFFGEKTMPGWLSRWVGWLLRWRFQRHAAQSTYEVLRSLTSDERLISVLCAQCGDYGLTPRRSSFGIHAVVVDHYLSGGSYPRGGARRIHETIGQVFEKNGGTLALRAEVSKILVENGRTIGVKMASGETLLADNVISNAGVRNTFERLLSSEVRPRFKEADELSRVKPSTAHVCLYVGLNRSDRELNLPKHNFWIYPRYDFDKGYEESRSDPESVGLLYLSFPSAKDPDWAAKHPGKSTIQVISSLDYDHVKAWENKPWNRRGDDYLRFKRRIEERLLQSLFRQLPQIRGHVEYSELSTPLSTRHFTGYQRGEIYGLEHTPERFRLSILRPRTSIKGLFLTGQDIVTVGIGGALYSGILTASVVLNRSVMGRILLNRPLG